MFDEDKCASRNVRMWRKIGGMYERAAYEAVSDFRVAPTRAARLAEIAEACFWQATGQGDFRGLVKIITDKSE